MTGLGYAGAARAGSLGLAPSLETLWEFIKYFSPDDPGDSRINVFDVRRLVGRVDAAVLRDAAADVIRRHDALRLVFTDTGDDPAVRIQHDADPPLSVVDLSGMPEGRRRRVLDEVIQGERFRGFDIRGGPLWHLCLVVLAADEYVLTCGFFHMISDGWSANVLFDDLMRAYHARLGQAPPLPAADITYGDMARIQSEAMRETPAMSEYWRRHLTPLPAELPFPVLDQPRDLGLLSEARRPFTFSADFGRELRRVAWRAKTTPYVALLAAHHVLLALRNGWSRTITGTTTLGRDTAVTRGAIGQFTNNVYLEVFIRPEMSLLGVVADVHSTMSAASDNMSSFKQTAGAVNPTFARQRPWPFLNFYHSWFQSAAPAPRHITHPGITTEELALSGTTMIQEHPKRTVATESERLPLWIKRGAPAVIINDDRHSGAMVYNPCFFSDEMISGAVRDYESIVSALVRDPDRCVGSLKLPSAMEGT